MRNSDCAGAAAAESGVPFVRRSVPTQKARDSRDRRALVGSPSGGCQNYVIGSHPTWLGGLINLYIRSVIFTTQLRWSRLIRVKNCRISFLVALMFPVVFCFPGFAEASLPALFADHMVVQRQLPVRVWGKAAANETVTVSFRGEARSTAADSLGRWSVYLAAGEAGGPFDLTVKASNTIHLSDVLVGDVWVASGQSNMEFEVSKVNNAAAEIAAAYYPNIRLLHVKRSYADYPRDDAEMTSSWTACTPESVRDFSAVAYFFGRDVQKKQKVPIGLIDSSWGGTPAEAWTSLRFLSADASLMPLFAARATMIDKQTESLLRLDKEKQETEAARGAGKPLPVFPWHPELGSWQPGGLYNAMIAPLTPYAIRGVIWYQGEANSSLDRAPLYGRLLQTLIENWRQDWGTGEFPFLFVQISNFKSNDTEDWAEVREGQRSALGLRKTGMVVSIDIGNPDDVHPTNKQDVGARLALAARAVAYGESIEYAGPLFRQVTTEGNSLHALVR